MKRRSKVVAINSARAATAARRTETASGFRAKLLAELGHEPAASEAALLEIASLTYAEIMEVSSRFLRGRSSAEDLTRLGLARGLLVRVLRTLGLPSGSTEPLDGSEPVVSIDHLVKRYERKPE